MMRSGKKQRTAADILDHLRRLRRDLAFGHPVGVLGLITL